MSNASRKTTYKLGEVCEVTDTQPYVLRFWESEFPQLRPKKGRSGQPVYRRKDVDIILRIKQLLHDEEYSIGDAREKLAEELGEDGGGQFSLLEAIENEPAREDRSSADAQKADTAEAAAETAEETPDAAEAAAPARSGPRGLPSRQSGDWVERDRYNDAVQEIARLKREIADLDGVVVAVPLQRRKRCAGPAPAAKSAAAAPPTGARSPNWNAPATPCAAGPSRSSAWKRPARSCAARSIRSRPWSKPAWSCGAGPSTPRPR